MARVERETKVCTVCGRPLPLAAFRKCRGGRMPSCEGCNLRRLADVRARRREEAQERLRRDGGKTCVGPCGLLRPVTDFAEKEAAGDGLQSWCRECTEGALTQHRERFPTRATENWRKRHAADPEKFRVKGR